VCMSVCVYVCVCVCACVCVRVRVHVCDDVCDKERESKVVQPGKSLLCWWTYFMIKLVLFFGCRSFTLCGRK
jgi:hypothetical protein